MKEWNSGMVEWRNIPPDPKTRNNNILKHEMAEYPNTRNNRNLKMGKIINFSYRYLQPLICKRIITRGCK